MAYRVRGLDPSPFRHLYGLSDDDLAARGVCRVVAEITPGFPDRIEVRDAEPGERLLLLNYVHQPADTAYRASHAVFILEGALEPLDRVGSIPEPLRIRPISLRAFSRAGEMIDADLVDGSDLEPLIERLLENPYVEYLQAHYAKRGCYAARVERG